ncbi:hypothetical protein VOLCADRAFT_90707 [Volvox carteri f. nagariensis]|uniref:Helicase C-terminal domain-containing protein n=1 Tax=Volvox carteri f. nagariensis TaxID=3068 RepID=D8TVI3_VOLCA|nr:uncharacterized protein VOLCADRAFT_90707 [Volvox carteri f. nagariensis]EFJ48583.1 hypothetical protein VOLCADRAFT_90707 [Volvox carteri f. nagariensis]|eukprot:XP_002950382.1 hypothetical protein VOLCADRAFT_90707 [Volvox carteri f. nagariensis]
MARRSAARPPSPASTTTPTPIIPQPPHPRNRWKQPTHPADLTLDFSRMPPYWPLARRTTPLAICGYIPNGHAKDELTVCGRLALAIGLVPDIATDPTPKAAAGAQQQQQQQQLRSSERCYSTSTVRTSTDFISLGITPELQERLSAQGIQTALPVQAAAVPLILSGRNTAIKSCTGSGKVRPPEPSQRCCTADTLKRVILEGGVSCSCMGRDDGQTLAYLLPVIQLGLERRRAAEALVSAFAGTGKDGATTAINATATLSNGSSGVSSGGKARQRKTAAALKRLARSPQAVIVTPSRELCIQIQRAAQDLIPGPVANRRLVQQLIGGANPRRQEAALAAGAGGLWPLVVVGTPGRVADMVAHGSLHVWGCPLLVLDEVDQLYDQKELRKHVDTISAHVGRRAQQQHLHTKLSCAATGTSGKSADGSASPAESSPPNGLGHPAEAAALSGGGGGRQTVIVSASLDARDPSRYAAWCPDPAFVVLGSMEALPPSVLQTLHPSTLTELEVPVAAGEPDGGSGTMRGNNSRDADGSSGGSDDRAVWPGNVRQGDIEIAHLYVLTHSKHRTDRVRRLIHALRAERVLLFVPKQNQTMVTKYRLEARRMEPSAGPWDSNAFCFARAPLHARVPGLLKLFGLGFDLRYFGATSSAIRAVWFCQVTILHGRLSKLERGNIMEAFRRGVFRTLIVTDLGARGLDLPDCDAVINFGPPADALSYAHRAGRTGRAGAAGIVVSVVTRLELPALRRIAKQLGLNLQAASVSHGTIAPGEEAENDEQAERVNSSVISCYGGDS